MNAHKRHTIQSLIIKESGNQTLDLNDIVLGYEGARIVGTMIPQYHQGIRHIRVNGNNIDSEGFEIIFTALLHCPHLKSIEAEWNNIGSAEIGLAALCHLVQNLQYIQFLDLKNNRIGHHLAGFIAQILDMNKRNLKVIDLRWNDLGELGAKAILSTLGHNKNIKFLGLEDNRISTGTLMEIQSFLRINTGAAQDEHKVLKHSSSMGDAFATHSYFPISGDQYPGMDTQVKTGEIRNKIDNEQKQAQRYTEKMEVEIQKLLQKLKLRGSQINEMQLKYDSILVENEKITTQLRQAERILSLQKQRAFGIQRTLNQQKSQMRAEKYKINNNIQNVMEKFTQRNQRQLEELEMVMNQKLDRLNIYLKERLHEKRTNRQKLTDLKEDIMKFKLNKEDIWNKGASNMSSVVNANINKSAWEEEYFVMDQMISSGQSTIQAQTKKGDYMSEQLNTQIIRALKKQKKLEDNIFTHQNKIKSIHSEMAHKNIEIEKNLARAKLIQSKIFDKQLALEMQKRYVKYIQSQNQISIQIENMKQDELNKANRISDDTLDIRIADVERALRAQVAQNKMIKNQYEKMMTQLQAVTKKNIQAVLYE